MRSALAYGTGAFALLLLWYATRYGDCTAFFFHFDDFWLLGDASRVTDLADVLRPGRNQFVLYRPFSQIAYFWILRQLFGYDPAPYHAAQLLAHVFNAFLVYGVASVVLRSRPLGLGAAAIYAAEPGHAIAVYWNALYSMTGTVSWYLACLWVWLQPSASTASEAAEERRSAAAGGSRGTPPSRAISTPLQWTAAFLLFLGAMLSSEHALTLPVALALASIVIGGDPWPSTLRRLAPFFFVAIVYGVAKVIYMRSGLDLDYADSGVRAFIRQAYAPVFAPLESLRLLGFYAGCAIGWLYGASPEAPRWYGVGATMLAFIALSACWARVSAAGRQVFFGLLLFVTALGPVLLLPRHSYSYYVGTAGAGIAIAIMATMRALPRAGAIAPAAAVAFILAGEVLVGEPRVKANDEFRFFREFQIAALRWIKAVDRAAHTAPDVAQVVVPRHAVNTLVFDQGQAHRLLLGATYDVLLTPDIASEPPAAGKVMVARTQIWRKGTDYPGRQRRWDWLRGRDPWANR